MKKYLKLILLILYPYAYLIYFLLLINGNEKINYFLLEGFKILFISYNLLTFILIILNIISTQKNGTPLDAAKVNIAVKFLHIPAYVFHFLMGMAGTVMSIWGIGFIMLAVIVDTCTIFLSGLNALSCSIKLYKEGSLKKKTSILLSIGSFIYCIDVMIAIIYLVVSKISKNKRI